MKRLGLGVLGMGEGRSIISAAIASEKWDLVKVCDLNEELGAARCREFGIDCYTPRYEELLHNPLIDVIAIYTPDELHAEHILAALAADKHVICTKPLFTNLDRAREILDVADRSKRRLFVGQSSRFFEPMIHQRHDYDAGRHGEILTVESHYYADNRWFPRGKPWARNGGLRWLYGGVSHPVDLVRWYLPDIDEVMGYGILSPGSSELGIVHPDTMHFVIRTRSGKIARVSGAYGSPPLNQDRQDHISCIIRGTDGASEANYGSLCYFTNFNGETESSYRYPQKTAYYFRFEGHSHHAGEYQNYIEYFADCVAAGQPAYPDAREGVVTVATMMAMERSMETGRPVRVAEILTEKGLGSLAP